MLGVRVALYFPHCPPFGCATTSAAARPKNEIVLLARLSNEPWRKRELRVVEDKKTTNLPKRKQHQQAAEEKSRTNNYLPADVLISKPKNKPTEKKTINNRLQMCGAATAVTSACCTLYSDVRVFCAELLIDFCTQLRSDCITSTHAITRSFFATREEGTEKERERVRCCKTESAVASLSWRW